MSNIIDSIQVSGVTYTIQGSGGGGNPTVELTQAEYDALVSAGTVSANTYYIITDATAGDLTQYWTSAQTQSAITSATSGKVDTTAITSSVTSASTDAQIPTAKAVYNAVGSGGGGKAIEAGRGISIETGETADTVSFNLPIWTNSYNNSVKECYTGNTADFYYSHAEGYHTEAKYGAHSEGSNTKALGYYSHAEGQETIANNQREHSSGSYNISNTGTTTSAQTLFSVGNGTADNARHNAFEIRVNGDIYLNDGTNDVKLQDYLQIKAVKVTQAEYDALVSGGTVDANTLYIITNVVS